MPRLPGAILICAALALFSVPASPDSPDIRFPLVQDTHHGQVYVWSPGVRRAPEFFSALQKIYASDLANAGNKINGVERVTVEEMATVRFESIDILTLIDALDSAREPVNWDLTEKRIVGWNDLLKDSAPGSPGVRAIADIIFRHHSKNPGKPKSKDAGATSGHQARGETSGSPGDSPLPPFALVPAKDGKSIAGLLLYLGTTVPFGADVSDGETHERFLSAALLKPWLAGHYGDLFGGAPLLFREDQREGREGPPEPITGMSAIIFGRPQRPAAKLAFRGEAPAVYFNHGTIDVVAEEAKSSFVAQGHAIANARPSGVAWGMQVFEVSIDHKLEPFWSVCYDPYGLQFRAARGSPADLAKIAPIEMMFPIKYDCGDYGG